MSQAPTPLDRLLRRRLALDGPMSVADFMSLALAHPEHGYYRRRDPFGRDGDFVTAPEISQMFGELIGLWCVSVWRAMGQPDAFHWLEFGPGRGTLMADAWRATRRMPGFQAAARLTLIETSPALRAVQRDTLERVGATAADWLDAAGALPDGPVIAIANEFVDALPVHQLERRATGWHERLLALDPERPDALALTLSPGPSARAPLLAEELRGAPIGAVAEVCPAGIAFARELGARVARFGGAALIVDYGYARPAPGETMQAVRRHAYAPVFEAVGEADITAHVDFAALARAAREAGAGVHGPVGQGAFLAALGIAVRAEALKRAAGPRGAPAIEAALRRLIGPDAMGTLFKALAITAPALPVPAGFEARA